MPKCSSVKETAFEYLRLDASLCENIHGQQEVNLFTQYVKHIAEQKLSLKQVSKDYYQNLESFVEEFLNHGGSVMTPFPENSSSSSEGRYSYSLPVGMYREILVTGFMEIKADGTYHESVCLERDFDWFICHPNWNTTEMDIFFKDSSGNAKHIRMENHEKTRSRYLFAFALCTKDSTLSVAEDSIANIIVE